MNSEARPVGQSVAIVSVVWKWNRPLCVIINTDMEQLNANTQKQQHIYTIFIILQYIYF